MELASRLLAPSFYRNAQTGKTLKELLCDNNDVTKRLGFVIQFQNKNPLNSNVKKNIRTSKRRRIKRNYNKSDESSDESVQNSSENNSEENNVPRKKQNRRKSSTEPDLDSLFE